MPSYFCMGVAEALSADVPLAWYRHLPDGEGPRLGDAARGGRRRGRRAEPLRARRTARRGTQWIRAHPGVTVLEDHSHDPFSAWARTSSAPYAVASLAQDAAAARTAACCGRRAVSTCPGPPASESPGAHLKLAAMLLKAAWLGGRAVAEGRLPGAAAAGRTRPARQRRPGQRAHRGACCRCWTWPDCARRAPATPAP